MTTNTQATGQSAHRLETLSQFGAPSPNIASLTLIKQDDSHSWTFDGGMPISVAADLVKLAIASEDIHLREIEVFDDDAGVRFALIEGKASFERVMELAAICERHTNRQR